MSHGTSTIIVVKNAILTGLRTAAADSANALHAVNIGWSHPGKNKLREDVFIGGTAPSDVQQWATIGNRQREENYSLQLVIAVIKPGADAEEVERRAAAMLAAVETWLRDNPDATITPGSVAGVGSIIAELARADLNPFFTDVAGAEGRGAAFDCDIAVTARI